MENDVIRLVLSRLIYPVSREINPRGWELREKPMIEEAVRFLMEEAAALKVEAWWRGPA